MWNPNPIFFLKRENNFHKSQDNFDTGILSWKSEFTHFCHLHLAPFQKDTKFDFVIVMQQCTAVWPQWWSFSDVSQKGLPFCKKISKKNNFLIWLWQMFIRTVKKLGTILENKVVQKLKFSKNDNNKKPSSKLIFFNEKKSERLEWFLT